MELLAPAGNMSQAMAGIENGCNALYGGLKHWGARSKCDNFSIDEYNDLLQLCHNRNVKFYLTLNNLLLEDELRDISTLFYSNSIEFPDAIICADIGLIDYLHNNFPDIPLHASTQFGAYTIHDINFLEQLGVSRVILGRELSIAEIGKITSATNLEIEVFVFGSQCIAFSGQCIWGGTLNKTSGNRGRCNGFCREIYECNGQIGEFLYQKDLDAIGLIDNLKKIGVSSVKIEGRYRAASETADIVHKFRDAIDGQSFPQQYNGYLSNSVNFKEMFSAINSRHQLKTIELDQLCDRDLVVVESDNGDKKVYFYTPCLIKRSPQFWKCLLYRPGQHCGIRVLVEFTSDGSVIKFYKFGGLRLIYEMVTENKSTISVKGLFEHLRGKLENELVEFSANVPADSVISIDLCEIDRIVLEVNTQIHLLPTWSHVKSSIDTPIVFLSSSLSDICKFQDESSCEAIYQITSLQQLNKALNAFENNANILFKLPMLDFSNNIGEILQMLKNRRIIVNTFAQLMATHDFHYSEIVGNYTLNLWNSYAIQIAKDLGIQALIIHPEVSYSYYRTICSKINIPLYAFGHVHLPVGYTRACLCGGGYCSQDCLNNQTVLTGVGNQQDILVICDNEFGYRKLVPSCAFITDATVENDTKLIVDASYYAPLNEPQAYINNENMS